MLDKLEKFNRRFSEWFEWIGAAGLLLIMLITSVDVVGAKVFSWRLFGALDVVMLSQTIAIGFAAAVTLIIGRHVRVEFFVSRLPERTRAVVDSIIFLLGLGLFITIIWRLSVLGLSFQNSGEYSATAHIPIYPFVYAIAAANIPVCLVLFHGLLKSIARVVKG